MRLPRRLKFLARRFEITKRRGHRLRPQRQALHEIFNNHTSRVSTESKLTPQYQPLLICQVPPGYKHA